jgi:NTP pyrophosphatase (non-canonical NTP hydrolase)
MSERANDNLGPFSLGSDVWPGLSKLGEECAEVLQVIFKLLATGGRTDHWSGDDLAEKLGEELADLGAAMAFVIEHNLDQLDNGRIMVRTLEKADLFEAWHGGPA